MSSVLEIRTLFVRPGTVRFSYKVDAEPKFDGLMFFIDNVKVMNLTSNTNGFELFTADVSAGYHRFGWRYYKDLTITEGEDQAVLRMIEFEGTAWADDFCTPCPVGQFSLTGAIDCIPCPFGTYANQTGTAMCAVCPEGTYAYEESAECSPKPPCTADDYATIVAPCSNNQRVRSYRWTAPQICDPELAQSVPLPADETIACAPCPGGTVNTGGVCVACPNGFARAWNEQQCSPCPAGTAALKSQHFHTWDAWDNAFFDTFCEGECGMCSVAVTCDNYRAKIAPSIVPYCARCAIVAPLRCSLTPTQAPTAGACSPRPPTLASATATRSRLSSACACR